MVATHDTVFTVLGNAARQRSALSLAARLVLSAIIAVAALVAHFASLFRVRTGRTTAEWSPEAIALLQRHSRPGNVRELANIVERLVILHSGQRVPPRETSQVLSVDSSAPAPPPAFPDPSPPAPPLT